MCVSQLIPLHMSSSDLPYVELRRRLRRHRPLLRDRLPRLHALLPRPHDSATAQGAHEVFPRLLEHARVRHARHGHRCHRHVRHEEAVRCPRHEAAGGEWVR